MAYGPTYCCSDPTGKPDRIPTSPTLIPERAARERPPTAQPIRVGHNDRPRSGLSLILATLFLAALTPVSAQTSVDQKDSTPPIDLPPLVVEESKFPVHWHYVALPGIEILSQCAADVTEEFAESVAKLEEIRRMLVPDTLWLTTTKPQILILVREEHVARIEDVVTKQLLEKERDRTSGDTAKGAVINFLDKPLKGDPFPPPPPMRFLPNLRIWGGDGEGVFTVIREFGFAPERLRFTWDTFLFRLQNRAPPLPEWYVEAMIDFSKRVDVFPTHMRLKAMTWGSALETEAIRNRKTYSTPLAPLLDIFQPDSENAALPIKERVRNREQRQLFLQWILADESDKRRASLGRFLEQTVTQPPSEALFERCFGQSSGAIRKALSLYLEHAVKRDLVVKPPAIRLPRIRVRSASDVEIARLKGEWDRLEYTYVKSRQPQFASLYLERARRGVERAHKRQLSDRELTAQAGLLECDAGDDRAAKPLLEAAVQLRVARPRVYYELARIQFAEHVSALPNSEARLETQATIELLMLLSFARQYAPPLPEVYQLTAEIVERSSRAPDSSEVAVLEEGLRLFPHDSELAYAIAEAQARHVKNTQRTIPGGR